VIVLLRQTGRVLIGLIRRIGHRVAILVRSIAKPVLRVLASLARTAHGFSRAVGSMLRRLGHSLARITGVIVALARSAGARINRVAAGFVRAVQAVWARVIGPLGSAARFGVRVVRQLVRGLAAIGRAVAKPVRRAAGAIARVLTFVSRGVVGAVRRVSQVLGAGFRRVRGLGGWVMNAAGALVGRAKHGITAGARLAGTPIRAAGRVVKSAASKARSLLKPTLAIGRRARLASSTLTKNARASARQLVTQTRQALRSAVRR
jgi:hypothetical protein